MLILTRRLGESIKIGNNIQVTVLGIRGRQVRLGVDAPADTVVHRQEIHEKIQLENRAAQQSVRGALTKAVGTIKTKLRGSTPDKPKT